MVQSVVEVIPVDHDKIQDGIMQLEISEIAYKALPGVLVDHIQCRNSVDKNTK